MTTFETPRSLSPEEKVTACPTFATTTQRTRHTERTKHLAPLSLSSLSSQMRLKSTHSALGHAQDSFTCSTR